MHAQGITFSLGAFLMLGISIAPAQQSTKFQKWLTPNFFRGFDVGYYCFQSPCVRTQQDLFDLKNTGANLAQISVYGESFRHPQYPYDENPVGRASITAMVNFCRTAGIYYTIVNRVGPGRYDVADEDTSHVSTIWHKDSTNQVAIYGKMLKEIAAEFSNDTLFVGLDLALEPDPLGMLYLGPDDLRQALSDSGINLYRIYKTWIDSVRRVDRDLPLIVQSAQLSDPEYWGDTLLIQKQDDPHIVYEFHSYGPHDYSHNPVMNGATYPGTYWNKTRQASALWDSVFYHDVVLAKVRKFQQTYSVPIFMGEFGMRLPQNNGEKYLENLSTIATGYGWHFALWVWRSDTSDKFIEWNYEKFDYATGRMTRYWQTVLSMFHTPATSVAAPQAPTLAGPADAARNVSITPILSWARAVGATTYRLQVSLNPAFSTTVVNDSTITDTTKAVGPLQNNVTYFWRLCAKNEGGTSGWSLVRSFTTIVAAPTVRTLATPANGATNVAIAPTLTWNAVTGATYYHLQVSSSATFTSTVLDKDSLTRTSFDVTGSANATRYYWRVLAWNIGGASAYSTAWSFTTIVVLPAIPTLQSPDDTSKNVYLNPMLRWNPADGAASYHLQVSMTSAFTTNVVDDTTLTGTQSTIGPLELATTYYWRVRAKNIAGYSAFSATRSFKTILTTSVEQIGGDVPKEYALSQNFPNPFNPTTTIQFALPKSTYVTLRVFDALGKEVATLVTQELGPGYFTIRWPANVPSGIYFYRLQAGEYAETKKMILLR